MKQGHTSNEGVVGLTKCRVVCWGQALALEENVYFGIDMRQ